MVTISFDDGYASDYDIVFPILQEYGIRGTFFVLGDEDRFNTEGLTTASQLKEMAESGQEIASHGKDHLAYFIEQDNNVIYNDMVESKKVLENAIGRPVLTIAYPYGGGDQNVGTGTIEDAERVQNIAGAIYESARGTATHIKRAPFDTPYYLATLYGDKNTYNVPCFLSDGSPSTARALVNRLMEADEPYWVNIAFHKIYRDGEDKPSNRINETTFRNEMRYISNMKKAKLIDVVPFYEGARRIKTGSSYLL